MNASREIIPLLFNDLSVDQFSTEFANQARHHIAHGDPARFRKLFAFPNDLAVQELVARHRGNITASVRDQFHQQRHLFRLTAEDASTLYDSFATLHLDDFEHTLNGGTATFANLAREMGLLPRFLRCTGFAAVGPPASTPVHCDTAELFVLQLRGTKEWSIGPNHDVPNPLKNVWPWGAGGSTVLRKRALTSEVVTLHPGSVLYLPRGHWHATRVVDGPCISVTAGFETPTWLDVVSVALHNQLHQAPHWRSAIGPAWGSADQRSAVQSRAEERIRALKALVFEATAESLLHAAFQTEDGIKYIRRANVDYQLTSRGEVRNDAAWATEPSVMLAVRSGDRVQELRFRGQPQVATLHWILNRTDPFSAGEIRRLHPDLAQVDLKTLLVDLERVELLESYPAASSIRSLGTDD